MTNGVLRALDDKVLTERTGKVACKGSFTTLPIKNMGFAFYYDKGESRHDTDPSPGIWVECTLVENIGNVYRMFDTDKRQFELIVDKTD